MTSKLELERIKPVNPPKVNKKINPKAHKSREEKIKSEPKKVNNQLNTFKPVGTAIIIVADVK
jgi:hypothetical protein